jgi:hypothetical protein
VVVANLPGSRQEADAAVCIAGTGELHEVEKPQSENVHVHDTSLNSAFQKCMCLACM